MKKFYILGLVLILALSVLLAGCGAASKSETTPSEKQGSHQSQDMGNMSELEHSKM